MPQGQALQTLLGIMQIKQQREEADQRAEAERQHNQQAGWQVISGIARRTADPMLLTKLASQGEAWGLGKASDILDTISKIQPDEDALRSFGAVQGAKAATGVPGDTFSSTPQSERLFSGAASRVFAGAGQGEVAGSQYTANLYDTTPDLNPTTRTAVGNVMRARTATGGAGLTDVASDVATGSGGIPEQAFRDAFSMAHGFTPTYAQKSASDLGWANLRSEDAYRSGQTAIGMLDAQGRARNASAQGQLEPKNLPDLFNTQRQLLNDLQTNLTSFTPADKLARLRSLRGLGQTIRASGGYAPDFDENEALQAMNSPGAWDTFVHFMNSKPAQHP